MDSQERRGGGLSGVPEPVLESPKEKVIPYGECQCGCGGKTRISDRDNAERRYTKGEPRRFIYGHHVPKGPKHHNWRGGKTLGRNNIKYPMTLIPDHPKARSNGYVSDHVLKAEKALGKSLPKGAIVHHHTLEQLVVCQNQSYHAFIERRTRAYRECGHADWLRCPLCKQWDDPQNLYVRLWKGRTLGRHRKCHTEKEFSRRHK